MLIKVDFVLKIFILKVALLSVLLRGSSLALPVLNMSKSFVYYNSMEQCAGKNMFIIQILDSPDSLIFSIHLILYI